MHHMTRHVVSLAVGSALAIGGATAAWSADTLQDVMKARGLTEKDVLAAAKTYTPTGGRDEYMVSARAGRAAS